MAHIVPTPQQQRVVAHPAEPLRVSAGAGTGKTATIVERLAAAVEDGLAPEAALGVTFTNKAAEELGDRLRQRLPAHAAEGREVEVATYHGFAYGLLREFGPLVGIERDTEVIGPGYVRQLLGESLTQAGEFDQLDMTAVGQRVADAATLAGHLSANLLGPEDLETHAPETPDDVWAARLELGAIVATYEQLKRRLDVVDYGDLILLAHRLVTEHTQVAERIRSRYRLVLLDEYQDTSPSQRELLLGIFGAGFAVTAVGDTDQTIYEWRGASLENFEGFPGHFSTADGSPADTLPLTVNFRSGPRILEVAHAVRSQIHGDSPFERLVPAPDAPDDRTEARFFRTSVDEAVWIAEEAARLHDEEAVAWRNQAILFRKNQQIALVRDACHAADIPTEVASLGGLLDVPEVADLHAWLRIIDQPDDAVALARILLGSRYRLGLGDLAPLARWVKSRRRAPDGRSVTHLDAIDHIGELDNPSPEASARLMDFAFLYRELLAQAQGVALVELCRLVLDGIDAWAEVDAMDDARGLSARLNLHRFLDLAESWSPLAGRPSVTAFLAYLEVLEDEQSGDELDTARVGGEDAVTLLTVHRAKGLEWDTVFLPALSELIFPASSHAYDNPLKAGKHLPYDLRIDADALPSLDGTDDNAKLRARHEAAEWRTAHVAVTRAQRRLYMTGAAWYGTTIKPKSPSALFDVINSCPSVVKGPALDDPGEAPERLFIAPVAGSPDPLFKSGWQEAIRATLDDPAWPSLQAGNARPSYDAEVEQLRMLVEGLPEPADIPADGFSGTSVTGLVTLATCPRRFSWSEIERLPRQPAPWLRRGADLHRRIELHNLGRIAFDELDDGYYDIPEVGDVAGPGGFANFAASRFADTKPRFAEAPIDLRVGERRVRGRIDAIYEPEPGSWEIVDYKSGTALRDEARMVQLEAYAIAAMDGAIAGLRPDRLTVTFLYLGGAAPEEESVVVDEAWMAAARAHIDELLDAAAEAPYAPTPSPACHHCDFVRFCDEGREYLSSPAHP